MRSVTAFRTKAVLFCGIIAASPVLSQPAAAPTLAALAGLEAGQWQLRSRDGAETRSMCLGDPRVLLQVRHGRAPCSRFVIANDPRSSTVHYTCPGAGHGRTTIRVETPRLIQIDSQGIAENEPFAVQFEGRRTGACASQTSALRR